MEHPAAKLLVELSQLQDEEIGDGTTSVVVIAAELLKRSSHLVAQHIHPTTIIAGYRLAMKEACKLINERLSFKTSSLGGDVLINVAKTSMSSKIIGLGSDHFAKIAVDALTSVRTINDVGDCVYPLKAISIVKQHGASARESALVDGFALPMARAGQGMPTYIQGAKIALCDFDLRVSKMKLGVQILVNEADKIEGIKRKEIEITRDRILKMINAGANVILTTCGIDDTCMKYLVERNVLGCRRVKKEDLKRIAKATGGTVVSSLANLDGDESFSPSSLGRAESVTEERFADDECIIIRGGSEKTNSSIILRGANSYMLDEMERALHDALMAVKRVLESPCVVAGGGAVETAVSVALDDLASTLASREQLAVAEFSEALLVIPKQLAINAALDSVDLLSKLVVKHSAEKGGAWGLDLESGEIRNNIEAGVLEPAISKIKSIQFATECAITLLRIDELVKLNPRPEPEGR
eukprot:NODE_958_length_1654_cov_41.213084_g789_i0.p2 GENE.NODE_958_length_1654_cov_41.213084_g789_i0~~NODE_958_length_1654_cov_41.213084_g789_i0.p2  ORF type:complete len:538 (-),score=199.83 NODE_958_length_1654_cov_41.213084_g789_i0:40-1449(-)